MGLTMVTAGAMGSDVVGDSDVMGFVRGDIIEYGLAAASLRETLLFFFPPPEAGEASESSSSTIVT